MKSQALAFALLSSVEAKNHKHIRRVLAEAKCDEEFCLDGSNCIDDRCAGCVEFTCSDHQCNFNNVVSCGIQCQKSDCDSNSNCSGCQFCSNQSRANEKAKCPLGTFTDVTDSMFSQDPSYWYQPTHSGMPYVHGSSPLFIDLNGDGYLDYFNSLHGHKIENEDGTLDGRMELALTALSPEGDGELVLESIAERIIFEDNPEDFTNLDMNWIDAHGQNILDLDGDGILDLYIAQGSNQGLPLDNPAALDNFLFFGELDDNGEVWFRGGRTQAAASGVQMRSGRGRFNYMLGKWYDRCSDIRNEMYNLFAHYLHTSNQDMNGDGLIDIFASQNRRVDNIVSPSVLLINQGDRTWKEDRSMMEFPSTMMLTDADGDGIANEVMIQRGFCFPQRDGPQVSSDHPEYGKYTDEVIDFCSTRPVGTTAIYKFNQLSQKIEEISPHYNNVKSWKYLQPSCCPAGLYEGVNGCSAVSMASGDFDNDLIADQAILYVNKLVLNFSSERLQGVLPIGDRHQGLVLDLPEYCTEGESVRVVDLNNDGNLDIIVMCRATGAFAIYTQGSSDKIWNLQEDCSGNSSLGDITDPALAYEDLNTLFDGVECSDLEVKHYQKICKNFKKFGHRKVRGATGMTLVDLNNDGFTDAVVSHSFGYLRFFLNTPSDLNQGNRFISFKLKGDGVFNNVYGIGATLILTTFHTDGSQKKQFREISHHQHTSDNSGYEDDRVTFGLGTDYTPDMLEVTWPNGSRQVTYLGQWEFTGKMKPLEICDNSGKSEMFFSVYLQHIVTAI